MAIGSVHNVEGWSFIQHYGTDRLVVSLDGKIYQAGDELESKVTQLKHTCMIKIEKIRLNIKRRVKYAVCSIYEKGDWTVYLDYWKLDFLLDKKMDGDTYLLDIRTLNVRGKKSNLLLKKRDAEEQAVVYSLKKSKMEEINKVGLI